MSEPRPLDELDDLMAAVLDGTVADAQRRRLAVLLREEEARQRYVQMMTLHALLRNTLEGTAGEKAGALDVLKHIADFEKTVGVAMPRGTGKAATPAGGARGLKLTRHPWLLAASIALMACGVLWVAMSIRSGTDPTTREPVATLTNSHRATWTDTQGRLIFIRDKTPLPPQTLHLSDGLATLTFENGAVVVLDARWNPLQLRLESESSSFLHAGRITATVSAEKGKGFAVGVPGERRIVDLGTAFGVEVETDGQTQVHVIEGSVELRSTAAEPAAQEPRVLMGSEAVSFAPGEPVKPITADVDGFLTASRVVALIAPTPLPSPDGTKSVEGKQAGGKDGGAAKAATGDKVPSAAASDVAAGYRFERTDDAATMLADSGPHGRHGMIEGATWTQGHRSGRGALKFERPKDCVKIDIPGDFRSLTLAAWVRPHSLKANLTALFNADGFDVGDIHWQLTPDGKVEFSVNYGKKALNDYFSEPIAALLDPQAWTHLVTVYDVEKGQVAFYSNGALVSALRVRAEMPLRIDSAQIGNWLDAQGGRSNRGFVGEIGHLAIYGRALSAAEVKLLFDESR